MFCSVSSVYVAGKAATAGVPSVYAPSIYASSSALKPGPPATMIPIGPLPSVYNGYGVDYDRTSSGEWLRLAIMRLGVPSPAQP